MEESSESILLRSGGIVSIGDQFNVESKGHTGQYSHIYFQRLLALRPRVSERAKKKWPDVPVISRIVELKKGRKCVVVGTIFKEMPLRPNILEKYAKRLKFAQEEETVTTFSSENDTLVLEDESGRTRLTHVSPDKLTTGVVLALLGTETGRGEFHVDDDAVCLPGLPPQAPLPTLEDDVYVMIVSSLCFGSPESHNEAYHLLRDYICGFIGGQDDHDIQSKISLVLFAGNSLMIDSQMEEDALLSGVGWKSQHSLTEPLRALDSFLAEISSTVPVAIIPGGNDPSNVMFPQQPFHPALLPKTSGYRSTQFLTNPCSFCCNGVNFLGSAGELLESILSCTRQEDVSESERALGMLEDSLRWSHVAPIAPDLAECYPFEERDPFVINDSPHVCFAANQKEFRTSVVVDENKSVSTVLVPAFSETGTCVLVNLRNLECTPISFTTT